MRNPMPRGRAAGLAVLALAALAAPLVEAGNSADPETSDTPEDNKVPITDLVKAWIDTTSSATNITVGLQVGRAPPAPGAVDCTVGCAGAEMRYQVNFRVTGPSVPADYNGTFVRAWSGNASSPFGFVVGTIGADGEETVLFPVAGAVGETTLTWDLPRENASLPLPLAPAFDHAIVEIWARIDIAACGTGGCEIYGVPDGTEFRPADRMPDSGFGRDIVFPATPEPEPEPDPEPEPEIVPDVEPEPDEDDVTIPRQGDGPDGPPIKDNVEEPTGQDVPAPAFLWLLGALAFALLARRR